MKNNVINMARYYHHETIKVDGVEDDIHNSVRRELDITKMINYTLSTLRSSLSRSNSDIARKNDADNRKCFFTFIDSALPADKRQSVCSIFSTNDANRNRIHHRVIVSDYRKPIYIAKSTVNLLEVMIDCLDDYMSLYNKTDLIQSDISPNNLMINENNCGFVIDLDLAVHKDRVKTSGARLKIDIRVFMIIGVL